MEAACPDLHRESELVQEGSGDDRHEDQQREGESRFTADVRAEVAEGVREPAEVDYGQLAHIDD